MALCLNVFLLLPKTEVISLFNFLVLLVQDYLLYRLLGAALYDCFLGL